MVRVNIGCGQTPTKNWTNFDNSPAIKLASSKFRLSLARALGMVSEDNQSYISWLQQKDIEFANAVERIPLQDKSVDALYSSHMLEHLSTSGTEKFLREVKRVLAPDGVVRLSVPDLAIIVNKYSISHDAKAFWEEMHVEAPPLKSLMDVFRLAAVGYRHHQFMYDEGSLVQLLKNNGFTNITVQPVGNTMIADPGELDLYERGDESLYVEANIQV